MDKQLLMKINRTAFEVGAATPHDVYVSYFSKPNTVMVQIYRDGFGFSNEPETLLTPHIDGQVILHILLGLLNEKGEAA